MTSNDSPPKPAESANATGKRVLVVDDNVDAADLLGDMLSRAGHDVLVLNDPLVALQSIAEFAPDVAVLDIGLPGMDGYELAARVRQQSNCRMVALTGYEEDPARARSEGAVFETHLIKPVDRAQLLKVVSAPSPSEPERAD